MSEQNQEFDLEAEEALKQAEQLLRMYEKASEEMAAMQSTSSEEILEKLENVITDSSMTHSMKEEIETFNGPPIVEFLDPDSEEEDDEEYPPIEQIFPMDCWAPDDFGKESQGGLGHRKNVLEVNVPRHMLQNVRTGHTYLDKLMTGSGITPSTACLVTGIPGSGKTTFMIQAADCITSSGNIAIYNSNEESDVQISRVANRLKLKYGFEITNFESVFDVVAHARKIQEQCYAEYLDAFNTMKENGAHPKHLLNLRPKQVFLFLDSLQTLQMPHYEYDHSTGLVITDSNGEPIKKSGPAPKGDNMHLMITHYLSSAWCKKTFGSLFLIGQVTKNGEFAGKQGIKHWVDAHIHLDIDRDRKSETYQERIAEVTKNRFGPSGVYFSFEIEARGLKFKDPKTVPL